LVFLGALSVLACGPTPPTLTDAGITDAGINDAGTTDAGITDAGTTDAGNTDAGTADAGNTDAGSTDAGTADAGSTDAGTRDSGVVWERCRSDAGAPECQPLGSVCSAPRPLYAYSWYVPAHWDGGQQPPGGTLIAGEPISAHGGGNLFCTWSTDNGAPECVNCSAPAAYCHWNQTRFARNFAELTSRLRQRAPGHRAIFWIPTFADSAPHLDPRDFSDGGLPDGGAGPTIWWDRGAERLASDVRTVMAGLADAGLTVDWLFADVEWSLSNWTMGSCDEGLQAPPNPAAQARSQARWQATLADPRFPAFDQVWRSRSDAGFSTVDLCPVTYVTNGGQKYLQWNALMHERTGAYYTTGLYEPARAVFPQVRASNYEYAFTSPSLPVFDMHGHVLSRFGEGAIVGTHQSPQCYGMMGQLATRNIPELGPPTPASKYLATEFNSFRYGVNTYRGSALARPTVPMAPWIAPWHVIDDPPARANPLPMGKTPLWSELLLHVGAHAPDALIYWNNFEAACTVGNAASCDGDFTMSPSKGVCTPAGCVCNLGFTRASNGKCRPAPPPPDGGTGDGGVPAPAPEWVSPADVETADRLFETTLAEVNRVLGCQGRTSLQTALADWWAPWVVSGVRTEGRAVWRFTPQAAGTMLAAVGENLEASAGGRTLVFPRAWLVPSGVGFGRGQWVVQPGDAPPPFEKP
jgi:hypothetical protein